MTASEICEILDGKLEGDPEVVIDGPSKIEEGQVGKISFVANPKYLPFVYTTNASVLIVDINLELAEPIKATLIRVKDPYSSFSKILNQFNHVAESKVGIDKKASISNSAKIGECVFIGAFTYIGEHVKIGNNVKIFPNVYIGDNAQIGDNTIVYSGVNIYHDCKVGADCIFHSGVIIGGDGFGFAPQKDGAYEKIAQIGNVIIKNKVEVGANTTIDRATVGSTIIHEGVKLDNLIQVAHNVEIGKNTVIASQTGISGSVKIGKNCAIGGQVGFVGHITIADGSRIGAQSGVPASITEPNKSWFGVPLAESKESLKSLVLFKKLPEIVNRIKELEKELEQAKKSL